MANIRLGDNNNNNNNYYYYYYYIIIIIIIKVNSNYHKIIPECFDTIFKKAL